MKNSRAIDVFLNYEIKIKSMVFKTVDLIFMLCLFILAFMIRWKLFPIESADYWGFLELWMDQINLLPWAHRFPIILHHTCI